MSEYKTPSDKLLKTIEDGMEKNSETHDIIIKYGDSEEATAIFV